MNIAKQRNFLLKEAKINTSLNEMAKIQDSLKDAIDAVIAANPDLNGLPLKKIIRADQTVLDALDGDDIYDNQLNKYIATAKGKRVVGQRGRKPSTNSIVKNNISSDLGTSTQSLDRLLDLDDELGVDYSLPNDENEAEEDLDTWNSVDSDDDNILDKGPTKLDIDNSFENDIVTDTTTNAYKNIIIKKVGKIENAIDDEIYKREMAALKQYLKNPKVKQILGVELIRSLVSSVIG